MSEHPTHASEDASSGLTGDPAWTVEGESFRGLLSGYAGISVFAIPLVVLYLSVAALTRNEFTYTLDDAYIHLAVAKQIMAGGYGVNAGEFSAPSSSIVWPFILAPFALVPQIFETIPLIINSICLILSGTVLMRIFGLGGNGARLFVAIMFAGAFNLYGLVFTGMEHSLQILLVLIAAFGALNPDKVKARGRLRIIFYSSLMLLPAVRYEGLAVSIPILALMAIRRDFKAATISGIAMIGLLGGFSVFLYLNGAGILPSSVLVKSSHAGLKEILANIEANLQMYGWLLVLVCIYCVRRWKEDRCLGVTLLGVSLLHFTFGKTGWFGRYEVYYVAFVTVFILKSVLLARPKIWIAAALLPLLFSSLMMATLLTPRAASNIRNQHGVMASVARRLGAGVAVNDLGMVALRSGVYVLDLWGLASKEALQKRRSGEDPEWMSELMKSRDVDFAMVYDEWVSRPPDWVEVGELRLTEKRVTPASDTVSFYALTPESACRFASVLRGLQDGPGGEGHEIRVLDENPDCRTGR